MKKFVYENATVYITIPTDEQVDNIRKSTERFVEKLLAKGVINNEFIRRGNRRAGLSNINARSRDQKIK